MLNRRNTLAGDLAPVGIVAPSALAREGPNRGWPSWTPMPEMVERDPKRDGAMPRPPSSEDPYSFLVAGAPCPRAQVVRDRYLQVLGTIAPETTGTVVSSGCMQLLNEHIVFVLELLTTKTRIVLHAEGETLFR